MNDLSALVRSVMRASLFFVSSCLMVWAFIPSLKTYAAGLILGTVISVINGLMLQSKVNTITRIALENSGRRANSGFVGRISMVLIGTMISLRFPAFHMISTIIGFFFVQLATLILGFISAWQHRFHNEKR
ncbi:MAG: synthase-like protein [Paenibacillaceae bacterium]|jgi:ATP synthase protein I|nr:synthase-like protein [Paenibacillaceae bacterium]